MHRERLSQEFEERRDQLRKLALGILGCRADADDAVQETWLRLARSDAEAIDNPAGWLTTVTSRASLDTLRARHARCTSQLAADVAESVPSLADDPEREAVMAEMIGTTITVLLETLHPAERVEDAFATGRSPHRRSAARRPGHRPGLGGCPELGHADVGDRRSAGGRLGGAGQAVHRSPRRRCPDRGRQQPERSRQRLDQTGALLPGPDAVLAGPTFEKWLDCPDYETS